MARVAAPSDKVTIFVNAGSILPMGPPIHSVDELPAHPLTLDIYPAGATSYIFWEDDGISQGYLGGANSTATFSADGTSGHVVVSFAPQATAKYTYVGELCARTYVLKINGQSATPTVVARNGRAVPSSSADAFSNAGEG